MGVSRARCQMPNGSFGIWHRLPGANPRFASRSVSFAGRDRRSVTRDALGPPRAARHPRAGFSLALEISRAAFSLAGESFGCETRAGRGAAARTIEAPDAHARHTLHQQQWPLPLPPLPSSPPASRSPGTSRARVSRDGFRRAMLSAARSDDDWPIGLSRARCLARLATPRVGSSATLTSEPPATRPSRPAGSSPRSPRPRPASPSASAPRYVRARRDRHLRKSIRARTTIASRFPDPSAVGKPTRRPRERRTRRDRDDSPTARPRALVRAVRRSPAPHPAPPRVPVPRAG